MRRVFGRAILAVAAASMGLAMASCGLPTVASPAGAAASATAQGTLIIEPSAGAAPYINAIRSAKRTVDVNSYLLSDSSVISALKADAARGVVVHVIVAGNPYGDSSAPSAEMAAFKGSKAVLRDAPRRFEGRYVFDHAKYLVVDPGLKDETAILGSSNLTYSGLGGGDRDYDWETNQASVVSGLAKVFAADWNGSGNPSVGAPLVTSPGSEPALVSLINSSKHTLEIETEEFGYVSGIQSAIRSALRRGVKVEIVVPSSISSYDLGNVESLVKDGAKAVRVSSPYIHAKLIVSDGQAFIGSQNFSNSSLDDNREAGIILSGSPITHLTATFRQDFSRGRPIR